MMAGAIALYEEALHEQAPALVMRTSDGRGLPLQIPRWCEPPDAVDEALLQCCQGPVLDVGCGPGRLTIALTERGVQALGVRTWARSGRDSRSPGCVIPRRPGNGPYTGAIVTSASISTTG